MEDSIFENENASNNNNVIASESIQGRIFHWFWVKKTPTNVKLINESRKKCIYQPFARNYFTKERVDPIHEYLEDEDYLLMPINVALKQFSNMGLKSIPDDRFLGYNRETKELPIVKVELKEEFSQVSAKDACVKDLTKYGQASLCLPTGNGKTNVAIYIYGEMCKKENKRIRCLVVCHLKGLESQFADRIQSVCPGVKVGLLRDKSVQKNIERYDFVVGTVQSITKKNKPPSKTLVLNNQKKSKQLLTSFDEETSLQQKKELKKSAWDKYKEDFKYNDSFFGLFGMTIIDEAHRYTAEVWSSIFPLNNSRYLLQLTAQPKRGAGTWKRRELWCGSASFWEERTYEGKGVMKYFEAEYERIPNQFKNDKDYDKINMINHLCSVDERNEYMANVILKETKEIIEQGGTVLAVSERTERIPHLDSIKTMLKEKDSSVKVCIVNQNTKLTNDEIKEHNIILSTPGKMGEFFDSDSVAVIVLMTPDISNDVLYQLFGRGTRLNSKFKVVTVIYFIERYSWFEQRFQSHHKYFEEKLKFEIVLSDVKTRRGLEKSKNNIVETITGKRKSDRDDQNDRSVLFRPDSLAFKPKRNPF